MNRIKTLDDIKDLSIIIVGELPTHGRADGLGFKSQHSE